MVGASFHNASCDGAYANFGPQFHANTRFWIGVLQVVNQLRHVFDGINVMVRGWANKANTGC